MGSFATIGLQLISDNAIELGVIPKRVLFKVISSILIFGESTFSESNTLFEIIGESKFSGGFVWADSFFKSFWHGIILKTSAKSYNTIQLRHTLGHMTTYVTGCGG